MTFIGQKFNTPGVLRADAFGENTPLIPIAKGSLCCDRTVELCLYTSAVNVTAAKTITGFQYTFEGTQTIYPINGGAGIPVPAGGSTNSTAQLKAAFLEFLGQAVIQTNANVVLTTNTLTFTSTNEKLLVLDNVVDVAGATAFVQSACTTL